MLVNRNVRTRIVCQFIGNSGLMEINVNCYLFIMLRVIKCIVNIRVIIAFMNSSLYSCETYGQVKEMVILHLFIEHHYKSIVSIIRERHILTLHLSTGNWRIKLTTGCCCKNAAALHYTRYAIFYQIESHHSSSSCGLYSMHFDGTIILLYFIEMLPRTVSQCTVYLLGLSRI